MNAKLSPVMLNFRPNPFLVLGIILYLHKVAGDLIKNIIIIIIIIIIHLHIFLMMRWLVPDTMVT
jgi:hypothetical protein